MSEPERVAVLVYWSETALRSWIASYKHSILYCLGDLGAHPDLPKAGELIILEHIGQDPDDGRNIYKVVEDE